MSVSPQEFRNALANFASGVTVVTTADDEGALYGLTVSAFCSVSLVPPMVLVCVEKSTRCHDLFLSKGRFAVNVLGEGQKAVSERFATQIEDKFEGIGHALSDTGMPFIEGAITALDCRLEHSYDGGDHTIFVGWVEETSIAGGDPLLYSEGRYRRIRD